MRSKSMFVYRAPIAANNKPAAESAIRAQPNAALIGCCAAFLAGVGGGSIALAAAFSSLRGFVSQLAVSLLDRQTGNLLELFATKILPHILVLILLYLFAHCAFGRALSLAVLGIKGVGVGLVCGFLYKTYAWGGFLRCLLLVYPGVIIETFALVYFCLHSIKLSREIFSHVFKGGEGELTKTAYSLFAAMTKSAVLLSVGCLVDSLLAASFGGLFI